DTETGISGYRLQVKAVNGAAAETIFDGDVGNTLSYTTVNATNSLTYHARVKAKNGCGVEAIDDYWSDWSDGITVQYGSLTITSTPSGAKIYLDGNDTGSVTTWTFTNIPAGTHTIKLTLSGYKDWYGTTTVTSESVTYVYATLTPNTGIKVEIPPVYGVPGQTTEVLVRTPDDLTGKEVSSMEMTIEIDKNLLIPLSVLATDTLASSWGQPAYNITDGTITIAMAGAANLSGSGTLLRLLYQVNPSALSGNTCTIRFIDFIFNEGIPKYQINNGIFTVGSAFSISGKTDYYSNQELVANATITLTGVSTLTTTTNGSGSYQFINIDNGNWVLSADKGGDVKTS
ncbi:MAG: PEGA domain-containing protein, partial [Candidatus Desantisbacteria bacterium]